ANGIAVVSSDSKIEYCKALGAKAVLNRKNFQCWGQLPSVKDKSGYDAWVKEARKFGKAIWDVTGKGVDVDIVFEHPGESTFPVSTLVAKKGGMIAILVGSPARGLKTLEEARGATRGRPVSVSEDDLGIQPGII